MQGKNVGIARIVAIGWIQENPEMFGTKPEMFGCRVKAESKDLAMKIDN